MRPLHLIKLREWALDHPPARLRRVALHRFETLVSSIGTGLSPHAVSIWKEFIFGTRRSLEREQLERWLQDLAKNEASAKDFMIFALILGKFCERADVPLVCDQPPYWVPIDQVHLFDLQPAVIRKGAEQVLREMESEDLASLVKKLASNPRTTIASMSDEKLRRMMDSIAPFLLRFSEGSQIHNPAVRYWIAGNVYRARHAIVPQERRAAMQSLERLVDALLPPETRKEGPNEGGLSIEYWQIRNLADPILKKKYRNPSACRLSLQERFPTIPSNLLDDLADCRPREFALRILSKKYRLTPGHLTNLVKRGKLFHAVCAHWAEALLENSASGNFASRD